nr:hypothetical protein [Angustibacter aerolatus]
MRRTIQRDIEDVLSEKILYGEPEGRLDRPGRRRGRGQEPRLHLQGHLQVRPPRRAAGAPGEDGRVRPHRTITSGPHPHRVRAASSSPPARPASHAT